MDARVYIESVLKSLRDRDITAQLEDVKVQQSGRYRAQFYAKVYLYDESYLSIREWIDGTTCYPVRTGYSYQFVQGERKVFRYDNSPHHPELDTFPDHKHTFNEEEQEVIEASLAPSHNMIFEEIAGLLA